MASSQALTLDETMKWLTVMLRQQTKEAAKLDAAIAANLQELGYGGCGFFIKRSRLFL